jgi:NAD(P)-dependent dehydrogenase (short-subunit alcohol dehydrogenase family)
MKPRLNAKVCLITGSSGIGAATARLAASEGALVFVVSDDEISGRTLNKEIRCAYFIADLTRGDQAAAAVESCYRTFNRIDALFNVAGVSGRRFGDGPVHECSDDGWDMTMETNAKSTFLMCRETITVMLNQEPDLLGMRGTILNMSSVLADSPEPRYFATHAYAASKGAIIGLTRSMASYYASVRIRVNALAPGLTRTPMSARAQLDSDIREFMRIKQPLCEDLIEADDVARAAVFLMSDDARAITGEVLGVDGGWRVS